MKLKNINATLLILVSLLCLSLAFFVSATENSNGTKNIFLDSDQDGLTDAEEKTYGTDAKKSDTDGDGYSDGAEIKAGYDPLKKAPGDKLTASPAPTIKEESSATKEKQNLTEQVAQKISALSNQSDSDSQEIDTQDIQTLLDSIMNGEGLKNELPKISKDDIKILKQNYDNLSKEKKAEKMKEDAVNYSVAILYIFASNSPDPLTSSTDTISVINKTIQQIMFSFTSGNSENLNDLSESGKKIYAQLKEVKVPEDMADTQMKALQYALYAESLKNIIKLDPTDPLANLSNYTKIATFVTNLNNFYDEIKEKLDGYGIKYEEVQDKLKDQGISADIFGN